MIRGRIRFKIPIVQKIVLSFGRSLLSYFGTPPVDNEIWGASIKSAISNYNRKAKSLACLTTSVTPRSRVRLPIGSTDHSRTK